MSFEEQQGDDGRSELLLRSLGFKGLGLKV